MVSAPDNAPINPIRITTISSGMAVSRMSIHSYMRSEALKWGVSAVLVSNRYSAIRLKEYARSVADKNHLVGFVETLQCESNFKYNAINSKTGDYGVAQINAYWWKHITKKQMYDPYWSIDWAAKQFEQGHQHLWVCYNKLYSRLSYK